MAEEEKARRAFYATFDEPEESFVIGCDLNGNGRADLPQTERYLRCRQAYQERIAITNRIIAELAAVAEGDEREEKTA